MLWFDAFSGFKMRLHVWGVLIWIRPLVHKVDVTKNWELAVENSSPLHVCCFFFLDVCARLREHLLHTMWFKWGNVIYADSVTDTHTPFGKMFVFLKDLCWKGVWCYWWEQEGVACGAVIKLDRRRRRRKKVGHWASRSVKQRWHHSYTTSALRLHNAHVATASTRCWYTTANIFLPPLILIAYHSCLFLNLLTSSVFSVWVCVSVNVLSASVFQCVDKVPLPLIMFPQNVVIGRLCWQNSNLR